MAISFLCLPVTVSSIWVRREVEDGIGKAAREQRGCVLPLVIDNGVNIPHALREFGALYPLRDGLDACHEELLRKLQRRCLGGKAASSYS